MLARAACFGLLAAAARADTCGCECRCVYNPAKNANYCGGDPTKVTGTCPGLAPPTPWGGFP
eukprot:gene28566-24306_t